MNSVHTHIARIDKTRAELFLKNYEILRNAGLGVWCWGLFCEELLLAISCYGTPCFSPKRGWLYGIAEKTNAKIIQLTRGARLPDSPKWSASRVISNSAKQMYFNFSCPLIIVAYADQTICEVGTVYQACNAIYTGLTMPKGQANYVINGKYLSGWIVRKIYGTRKQAKLKAISPDFKVLPLPPKHRYIILVGPKYFKREATKLIKPFSLPYPKRNILGISEMKIYDRAWIESKSENLPTCSCKLQSV